MDMGWMGWMYKNEYVRFNLILLILLIHGTARAEP